MTFQGGNVRTRTWKLGVALALVVAVAASIVAAGSARPTADYRVAVVTDIGSMQDHGFNELANKGRLALDAAEGFETRLYETKLAADRLPNLIAAAQAGYDLVIGYGLPHVSTRSTRSHRASRTRSSRAST